jgi:TolA-binding protein
MTELSDTKDRISCADVALFLDEELSDVLSVEEQEEVSRHLSGCPQCSDFIKLTAALPLFAEELSKDELNFAVHKVMTRARQKRQEDHRRTYRRPIFALAASIALLTLAGIGLFRQSLFTPEAAETAALFQCSPTAPAEPTAGVFMTYCDDDKKPKTVVDNGGDVKVSLQSGTIGLFVDPNRPDKRKVAVETPQGTVRVKGTMFTVRVENENTWVEVFRGVVEIVPKDEDAAAFNVAAGHGVDLVSGKTFVLTDRKTDMLKKQLRESALKEGTVDARGGDAEIPEALSSNDATEPADAPPVSDSTEPVTEPHRGADGAPRHTLASMYDLIQEAQSCLIDRDWKCAAARYREVLGRYSRRPESMAVLISLAKVELRYLGAPKEALAHYKKYQRRAPNGPLAEEALFGIAEAYRRLGRTDDEEKTLRRFIEKFPKSSLTQKARTRMNQLRK